MGGEQQGLVRALSEANGQPSSYDEDVGDAIKSEEDDIGARDSDDYEEHKTRLAKGGDGEASKQLLSENESIWI